VVLALALSIYSPWSWRYSWTFALQPLRKYWRGTFKFWGAPLVQRHADCFLYLLLYGGRGKPHGHAKFEVASFNSCKNI